MIIPLTTKYTDIMKFRILCLLPLLLSAGACSVKEDRSVCPCELTVRSASGLRTEGNVLVSVVQDGNVVMQGMMSREDFEAGTFVLNIPRRPTEVTVFTGITEMNTVAGKRLDIRADHQCDEIYSVSAYIEPDKDSYDCIVSLHKNYARLDLCVIGMMEDTSMRIKGSVQGYDLVSLDPCEGAFACDPDEGSSTGTWRLRLPRQLDDSLELEFDPASEPAFGVRLGRMIAASGYSYSDEDLLDISVTVDLTKSSALVNVADWETTELSILEY